MKKIIILLVLFILIQGIGNAAVAHCWDTTTSSSSPIAGWDGCYAPLNSGNNVIRGGTYNGVILPGTKLVISNFGNYNFECDNGADSSRQEYYVLDFDSEQMYQTIPTLTNGPGRALDTGYHWCEGSSGHYEQSSGTLGYGGNSSIEYTFTDIDTWNGGHNYSVYLASPAIAGTFGTLQTHPKINNTFFFSPSPSLLVFGEVDNKYIYYEDEGVYSTTVFFTLVNKFPLKVRLTNLTLNCPTGLSCSAIDPEYTDGNWKITENDGLMIIPIDINFPKENINTDYILQLDVNYNIPTFDNKPICDRIYSTHSKPFTLSTRLVDMQNIQVGLIAARDQTQCIGLDGVVGQTGPGFAPKINIGFGGEVDSNGNLISMDECDTKTVNMNSNPDGVYCSQKELLIELGRKIAKIYDATKNNDLTTVNKYISFQTYLRRQSLSESEISASLEGMDELESFNTENTGLQGNNASGGFDTANKTNQLARLESLFDNVTFKNAGIILDDRTFFTPGIYNGTINLIRESEDTRSYLFDSENVFNPAYRVEIEFTPVSPPLLSWFFYEYANYEIDEGLINTLYGQSITQTNVIARGTAFTFSHDPSQPDINRNALYPTYATPLYIKINDINATSFVASPIVSDTFTYWTGFASNKGGGCDNIFVGNFEDKTVPYYKADFIDNVNNEVYHLTQANTMLQNGIMYLETIVYTPTDRAVPITLQNPFKTYLANSVCDGNKTTPCVLTLTETVSPIVHKVSDLRDVFDKINSSEICVHYGQVEAKTEWNLFWNEQKIALDLNTQKHAITDANLCALREILDTPQNAEPVVIPNPPDPEPSGPTCGNGTCDSPSENNTNCPADCEEACFDPNTDVPLSLEQTLGLSTPGLLAYLKLDDDLSDEKGNVNFVWRSTENYSTGKFGKGIGLNGDDFIASSESYPFWTSPPNNGTISFWAKLTSPTTSSSGTNRIFTVNQRYECFIENDRFQCDFEGASSLSKTGLNWEANSWHHIAINWSETNNQQALWIDGEEVDTANQGKPPDGTLFIFGAKGSPTNGTGFKGTLDELALFEKVLSDSEIKKIAKGPDGDLPDC